MVFLVCTCYDRVHARQAQSSEWHTGVCVYQLCVLLVSNVIVLYVSCLEVWPGQIFQNDLKFTTDGQQNQTSHEPRSRAFYFSINSLLHTWNSYYTEPPVKVPIMTHHFKYSYYGPPPIVIALGSFSRVYMRV